MAGFGRVLAAATHGTVTNMSDAPTDDSTVTISVDAAANAVSTTHTPSVAGHGGVWQAQASDPIPIRAG